MSQTRWLKLLRSFALICLCWPLPGRAAAPVPEVTILCYHEISTRENALDPTYTITPSRLLRQLDWLHNAGYSFISVGDLLDARQGRRTLPPKAVLLTFDDGYESVYQHVWPVLKLFKAPALVALVGSWLESQGEVDFDGRKIPRTDLLSWDQLREMLDSGLIEIASHSYDLHRGISANPQGNREPAAATRQYLAAQARYETEKEYEARVRADLKRNNELIRARLGVTPRVMVWPYGAHNLSVRQVAAHAGMPVGMTLDDGPDLATTPLISLRRILIGADTTVERLQREITIRDQDIEDADRAAKIMHVDLDNVYDPDPDQTNRNLGMLLDRIQSTGVNTVYLQAFADPDGNGSADAVYFPNRHLPVRSDLFNRVVWQISTRTTVKRIYAWMPLLAFELPARNPAAADVTVTEQPTTGHLNMGYKRLSLFSPRARQVIREIYQDLARSAPFQGLLFHDDATLSDYEDASPQALKTYASWGLPTDLAQIRGNDDLFDRWTLLKIHAIDRFALELADLVGQDQPDLKTARNLYAQVALNPRSETWYAQALPNSLRNYDFTAIMAMPYMEQAPDVRAFYQDLVDRVKAQPGGMRKTVFELQATNWRTGQPVPDQEMADTISWLYSQGVMHIGYYPDNFLANQPNPQMLRQAFSGKSSLPQLSP